MPPQQSAAPCHPQVLAARLLHVTCLPTLQLQRCEEYYGGLLHELHSEVRLGGYRRDCGDRSC